MPAFFDGITKMDWDCFWQAECIGQSFRYTVLSFQRAFVGIFRYKNLIMSSFFFGKITALDKADGCR